MTRELSEWQEAVEYGRHVFGVFPNDGGQILTGLLHHDGEYFTSYVDSGSWNEYPFWYREYEHTPLRDALEAFVTEDEMQTTEGVFKNQYYEQEPLESAGMSGWQYRYQSKRSFRRSVLRGDVHLDTPAILNRYGDIYCPEDDAENVREAFWETVGDSDRRSHYSASKTKSD